MNVLFVCSRNNWRSPTAEQVFADYPGIECASAGLTKDADTPLSDELVAWADIVFVMEPEHRTKLTKRFSASLKGKQVVCLDIPDRYQFMDERLVELLEAKVRPVLERARAV
ncbi:MAG: low molecular weight protein tyrosine phosphatase family protein [Myxococcota bacterium]